MFTKLINIIKEENDRISTKLFVRKVLELAKNAKPVEESAMVEVPIELIEQIELLDKQTEELLDWVLDLEVKVHEAANDENVPELKLLQ